MKSLLQSKKGEIGRLLPIITTLVVIGILLGVAFLILGKFQGALTAGSSEYNATGKVIASLYDIPNTWLSVIVTVVIAAIILFIVLGLFGGQKRAR